MVTDELSVLQQQVMELKAEVEARKIETADAIAEKEVAVKRLQSVEEELRTSERSVIEERYLWRFIHASKLTAFIRRLRSEKAIAAIKSSLSASQEALTAATKEKVRERKNDGAKRNITSITAGRSHQAA